MNWLVQAGWLDRGTAPGAWVAMQSRSVIAQDILMPGQSLDMNVMLTLMIFTTLAADLSCPGAQGSVLRGWSLSPLWSGYSQEGSRRAMCCILIILHILWLCCCCQCMCVVVFCGNYFIFYSLHFFLLFTRYWKIKILFLTNKEIKDPQSAPRVYLHMY